MQTDWAAMRLRIVFLKSTFMIGIFLLHGTENPSCGQSINACGCRSVIRGNPIELFDGTTLAGWEKRNGNPTMNWVVEDGSIHRKSNGGDLYHKHWYCDFELSFQWKTVAKGNSGVKYRVARYGNSYLGCEYQIQDDGELPINRHSTGGIYAVVAPSKARKLNAVGEWNDSKIIVCGHRIQHWLNGELIVEATAGNADWLKRIGESKFSSNPFFGQNREGRIFFQDHGSSVWYRKIVLVPLDCDGQSW